MRWPSANDTAFVDDTNFTAFLTTPCVVETASALETRRLLIVADAETEDVAVTEDARGTLLEIEALAVETATHCAASATIAGWAHLASAHFICCQSAMVK